MIETIVWHAGCFVITGAVFAAIFHTLNERGFFWEDPVDKDRPT